MLQTVLVFIGGGLGAASRHGMNLFVSRTVGGDFPWATGVINVTGSFLMGLAAGYFAYLASGEIAQNARLFLTTGILGGYTTFSAFSLDAALLWERGAAGQAAGYVVGSVALAILGLFAGLWVVRGLT
jgi:CrcB protein